MPAIININGTSLDGVYPVGFSAHVQEDPGYGWVRAPIGQRGNAATNNDDGLPMGSAAVRRVNLSVEAQEDPGLVPGAWLVVADYWLLGAGGGS